MKKFKKTLTHGVKIVKMCKILYFLKNINNFKTIKKNSKKDDIENFEMLVDNFGFYIGSNIVLLLIIGIFLGIFFYRLKKT